VQYSMCCFLPVAHFPLIGKWGFSFVNYALPLYCID
jgi:1,4-alpha-glucan branching enzyme